MTSPVRSLLHIRRDGPRSLGPKKVASSRPDWWQDILRLKGAFQGYEIDAFAAYGGWRNGLAEFAPHIEAGTIRALAISSAKRLPEVDVPTRREQGVNVEFENWRSVVAP